MVREGMTEARRAVTALRAETLPLDQTLRAQFWGAGEVVVTGEPRELSVEAGQTLIRAAQEALTNARRHAVGGVLDVLLAYRQNVGEQNTVELQVTNGPAARPANPTAAVTGSGMGLVGMRERAALLGGRVEAGPIVDGPLAGGWRVTMTLPINVRAVPRPAGRRNQRERAPVTEDEPELRLIVADDQAAIREALAMMLDMTPGLRVVATAGDGEEAVAATAEHRPDVVLMDLRMPKMDGIAATGQITAQFPEVAVVVLTTFDDETSIIAALGAGARGYLTKQAGRADIARAARTAAAGQSVLDPAVQARLVAAATGAGSPAPSPVSAAHPNNARPHGRFPMA